MTEVKVEGLEALLPALVVGMEEGALLQDHMLLPQNISMQYTQ